MRRIDRFSRCFPETGLFNKQIWVSGQERAENPSPPSCVGPKFQQFVLGSVLMELLALLGPMDTPTKALRRLRALQAKS